MDDDENDFPTEDGVFWDGVMLVALVGITSGWIVIIAKYFFFLF